MDIKEAGLSPRAPFCPHETRRYVPFSLKQTQTPCIPAHASQDFSTQIHVNAVSGNDVSKDTD